MKHLSKILIFSFFFLLVSNSCALADARYDWHDADVCSEQPGWKGADESLCSDHGAKPVTAGLIYVCCDTGAMPTAKSGTGVFTMINPFDKLQVKLPGILKRGPDCTYDEETKQPINCKFFWIGDYITWLYKYSIGIGGILATIIVMFAGFRWMMAAGDSSAVGEAKKYINGAVAGLIILMTSYLILFQISPDLVTMKPIELKLVQEETPDEADAPEGSLESDTKDCGGITMGWPSSSHTISSPFYRLKDWSNPNGKGWKAGDIHGGSDVSMPQGTPIYAATDGTVTMARETPVTVSPCSIVTITKGSIETSYIHLSKVQVITGQTITKGQQIGLSGGNKNSPGSCRTTGAHLHFQIKNNGKLVNPKQCLPGYSAAN